MIKTYEKLISFKTFEERLKYLMVVGIAPSTETFGSLRYLNQALYNSREWKRVRSYIIARDMGYDLGIMGREISGKVLVHHINPLSIADVYNKSNNVFDPNNLITTSYDTHQSIHYGSTPKPIFIERQPGDTKLW